MIVNRIDRDNDANRRVGDIVVIGRFESNVVLGRVVSCCEIFGGIEG